jgi:hypothetical protein
MHTKFFAGKLEGKRPFVKRGNGLEDNIKIDFK